ncbi:hypothetical protein [Paracoccus sp. (in: a-proteobacteria)]|uniref:hypothetical protein n=1 Tax=Paracoccus sp. TaxID=267 RepID=UPI00391D7BE2
MMYKMIAALGVALALGACSPKSFETEPVEIETPGGPVTCQLYTLTMTDWDRSIARPNSMSSELADAYCRQHGVKLLSRS